MEEQTQQTSAQVAYLPARLPGTKELLKRSWQIYKERFIIFLLISLVSLVSVPLFLIKPTAFLIIFPLVIFWLLVFIFLSFWQKGAILYAVKDREEKIGFKESFKRGLHKIWPLLGTGLLAGLIVSGGLMLLIIPGVIFGVWFAFVSYLVVAENLSGKSALSRSKQLVKGNFGGVFGRILALGILVAAISIVASMLFGFIFGEEIGGIFSTTLSVVIAPFGTVYMFLIYEELKKIKG